MSTSHRSNLLSSPTQSGMSFKALSLSHSFPSSIVSIVLKRKVVFVNLYLKHILIKYLIQNINKSDGSQMNWCNLHLNDYETNNLEITLVNK